MKSGDVDFANPSSQHTIGKAARRVINEARTHVFRTFGQSEKTSRLIFHSGATESFYSWCNALSFEAMTKNQNLLICFAPTDHPAVTTLGERFRYHQLKLRPDLTYDHETNLNDLMEMKRADPSLMILYHHLWVHNETGLVSPLEDLWGLKKIPDLLIHVDAVQAPGKIENWRELTEGDIFTFSAHKFGAFKGVGFSLSKNEVPFRPLFTGGGQQQGLRGGTENPQGVHSISLALQDLEQVNVKANEEIKNELLQFIEAELRGLGGVLTGPLQNSNTIYFYFNALTSDIALAMFDVGGLAISAGSACSSGAAKESIVLIESGHQDLARNGLRLSLGFHLDRDQLKTIKDRFRDIIKKLRK